MWITTLIISNKEIKDIKKTVKSGKEFVLLIKGARATIESEEKEQKRAFLDMLLSTLSANLLGNLLVGKGVIQAGEGMIRAEEDF